MVDERAIRHIAGALRDRQVDAGGRAPGRDRDVVEEAIAHRAWRPRRRCTPPAARRRSSLRCWAGRRAPASRRCARRAITRSKVASTAAASMSIIPPPRAQASFDERHVMLGMDRRQLARRGRRLHRRKPQSVAGRQRPLERDDPLWALGVTRDIVAQRRLVAQPDGTASHANPPDAPPRVSRRARPCARRARRRWRPHPLRNHSRLASLRSPTVPRTAVARIRRTTRLPLGNNRLPRPDQPRPDQRPREPSPASRRWPSLSTRFGRRERVVTRAGRAPPPVPALARRASAPWRAGAATRGTGRVTGSRGSSAWRARTGHPRAPGSTKKAIAAYCSAAAAITRTWKSSW